MSNLSIFEEFPKLTFGELQHLNVDDIHLCVNHTEAIQICKHSLEANEVNTSDIQKLWVEKLLKAYKAEELTEEYWIEILSFLDEAYKQLIEDGNVNEEVIKELNIWLSDCLKFIEWFRSSIKDFNVGCIFIVLGYALETVIGSLKFYRKWYENNNLKSQLQNFLNIHNATLKMINENLESWSLSKEREFSFLTEVIASLCVIGEQSSPIDFKIIVDTWKIIGKTTLHCAKYKHLEKSEVEKENYKWARRPMLFLTKEIKKNLIVAYKKDIIQQPVEQVEKYLRVTNFYTKLLQKLSYDFQKEEFLVVEDFLDLYLLCKRLPSHLEDHKVSVLLDKNVYQGLKQIFFMIYRNSRVLKIISENKFDEKPWCLILEDFLKAILTTQDSDFIEENANLLMSLLKKLFKDNRNYIQTTLYSSFIELYAALYLISPNMIINTHLKSLVLTSNLKLSSTCCDILLIATSYLSDELTFEDFLEEFYFWRKCNQFFTPFTSNSKQLVINRMLRHFYKCCRNHKDFKKDKLWNEYSDIQITSKNFRFFLSLDLNPSFYGQNTLQYMTQKLTEEVFQVKQSLVNGTCCFDNYYKLVTYLYILSTIDKFPLPTDYFTDIIDSLYKIFKKGPTKATAFSILIKALLVFISKHPTCLEESSLIALLNHISEYHSIFFKVAPVVSMNLLFCLKRNKNLSNLNAAIMEILSTAEPSKEHKCIRRLLEPRKVQWIKPIEKAGLYSEIQSFREKISHNCYENQPSKRLRLSPKDDSQQVKALLNNLHDDSNKLKVLSVNLNETDYATINNILGILNSIVNEKR